MTSISIPIENKRKSKIKIFVCSIRQNGVSIIICMFCIGLILYSNSSLKAAKDGLVLWATAVVPSLFPFFISIELLSHTNIVKTLGKYLNPIMRPLFNVPGEGAFAFLMGLISGYPVGAKVVVKLFEQNYCKSKKSVTILTYYEKLCPTLYQKAPKALVHFDWCTFLFLILHKKRFVSHGYEHAGIRQCVLCMSIPLRSCLSGSAHVTETF